MEKYVRQIKGYENTVLSVIPEKLIEVIKNPDTIRILNRILQSQGPAAVLECLGGDELVQYPQGEVRNIVSTKLAKQKLNEVEAVVDSVVLKLMETPYKKRVDAFTQYKPVKFTDYFVKGNNEFSFAQVAKDANCPHEIACAVFNTAAHSVGKGEYISCLLFNDVEKVKATDNLHGDIKCGENSVEFKAVDTSSALLKGSTKNNTDSYAKENGIKLIELSHKYVKQMCKLANKEEMSNSLVFVMGKKGRGLFPSTKRMYETVCPKIDTAHFDFMFNHIAEQLAGNDTEMFIKLQKEVIIPAITEMINTTFSYFDINDFKPTFYQDERGYVLLDTRVFQQEDFIADRLMAFTKGCNDGFFFAVASSIDCVDYYSAEELRNKEQLVEALKKRHFRLCMPITTPSASMKFGFGLEMKKRRV